MKVPGISAADVNKLYLTVCRQDKSANYAQTTIYPTLETFSVDYDFVPVYGTKQVFTVKTTTDITLVYVNQGGKTTTVKKGYTDVGDERTWSIAYTPNNKGDNIQFQIGNKGGTFDSVVNVACTIVKPAVNSVSYATLYPLYKTTEETTEGTEEEEPTTTTKTTYESQTLTVVTTTGANYLQITSTIGKTNTVVVYDADDRVISGDPAAIGITKMECEDADGVRKWTITYAPTSASAAKLTFKGGANGTSWSSAKTVTVTPVDESVFSTMTATVKKHAQPATLTIATSPAVAEIRVYESLTGSNDNLVIASSYKDSKGVRTWTLYVTVPAHESESVDLYAIGLHYAGDAAKAKTNAEKVTINNVTVPVPELYDATVSNPATGTDEPLPGAAVKGIATTLKLHTTIGVTKIGLRDANGKYVTTFSKTVKQVESDDYGTCLEWTIAYTPKVVGNLDIMLSTDGSHWSYTGSSEDHHMTVLDAAAVNKIWATIDYEYEGKTFSTETADIKAGEDVTLHVVTAACAAYVSVTVGKVTTIYNATEGKATTPEGGIRNWTINIGKIDATTTVSVKACANDGTAKKPTWSKAASLKITAWAYPEITSATAVTTTKDGKTSVGTPVTLTIVTNTSVQTLEVDGTTYGKGYYKDKKTVRTWTVTRTLTNLPDNGQHIFGIDGWLVNKEVYPTSFAETWQQPSVQVVAQPKVTDVHLADGTTVVNKLSMNYVVTTNDTTNHVGLFINGKLSKKYSTYTENDDGTRTFTIPYAATKAVTLTFRPSYDGTNYMTDDETWGVKDITAGELLAAVAFTKTVPTINQKNEDEGTYTVISEAVEGETYYLRAETNTSADYLYLYDAKGKTLIARWSVNDPTIDYTDDGTVRTWNVSFQFNAAYAAQKFTVKAARVESAANVPLSPASKAIGVKLTVVGKPNVLSAEFEPIMYAEDYSTLTVTTGMTTDALIVVYNGEESEKYLAAKYVTSPTVKNQTQKTWTIQVPNPAESNDAYQEFTYSVIACYTPQDVESAPYTDVLMKVWATPALYSVAKAPDDVYVTMENGKAVVTISGAANFSTNSVLVRATCSSGATYTFGPVNTEDDSVNDCMTFSCECEFTGSMIGQMSFEVIPCFGTDGTRYDEDKIDKTLSICVQGDVTKEAASNALLKTNWSQDEETGKYNLVVTGVEEGKTLPADLVISTIGGIPVTAIEDGAFKDNTDIETVDIADSAIVTIAASAFEGCTNLTSVTLSNDVTTIGEAAFKNCTSLTTMTCK